MALIPLNLLITHDGRSARQRVTCRYKCGDACSKPAPNTSDNEYFGDIAKAVPRRSVLQAGGIAVLAVGTGSALAACGAAVATPTSSASPAEPPPGMNFTAVAPNSEDAVVAADGYEQAVVMSWGDPVLPNAPQFDVKAQTAAAQRGQFGFNNDFAGLLPLQGLGNLDSAAALRIQRAGGISGRRDHRRGGGGVHRFAADKAGATKMDRPEDFEANPKTGKMYVALTNNDERGAPGEAAADAANPRNDNKSGQILEITDDHAGTSFTWELVLVCGDPAAADTYFAGFDKTKVSPISCPDNLAFDSHGNLWISTDGNALDSNDGLFAVALEGPNRGETKQFLTVPFGAETCGPVVTDDLVTVCVQHPGENDDNSIDNQLSRWPEGGNGTARPSVVAVWKANGQIGV